jgi:hypothetical protein
LKALPAPNPQSEIGYLQSEIPNLGSEIPNPQSARLGEGPSRSREIRNPTSLIARYEAHIRNHLQEALARLQCIQAERLVVSRASSLARADAYSKKLREATATSKTAFLTPPGPMADSRLSNEANLHPPSN